MTTHDFQNILVCREASRLYVTLNRPDVKNALSDDLVAELSRLVDDVAPDRSIRTLILRGAGGTFCAGADIKGFRESFAAPPPADGLRDPIAVKNRSFGAFLQKFNEIPQTTIGVVEGAAFGGGLGLTCIFDVVICHKDTKFSLSETGLGIPPAQIAPFVVRRVGMTNARRLALTGARFDGTLASQLGLVNFLADDSQHVETLLKSVLNDIGRCAPGANAATKRILLDTLAQPIDAVLDNAADVFARQLRTEGLEGVSAFLEKRPAKWVEKIE